MSITCIRVILGRMPLIHGVSECEEVRLMTGGSHMVLKLLPVMHVMGLMIGVDCTLILLTKHMADMKCIFTFTFYCSHYY